jgi:Domain of unknown function (DUF1707)
MTGPEEGAATAGRGHLRAAHADRDRVVATLKAAFVQGRLDQDELDARVGQALASRTYAELAVLTSDIPAGVTAAGPAAAVPPPNPARTLARGAKRGAIFLLLTVALFEGAILMQAGGLLFAAVFTLVAASGFFGYGVADAWHEQRELRRRASTGQGGQNGRGDDHGHRGLEGGRPGGNSRGRSDMPADWNGAELRAREAGQDRRHSSGWLIPMPRSIGPAPSPA